MESSEIEIDIEAEKQECESRKDRRSNASLLVLDRIMRLLMLDVTVSFRCWDITTISSISFFISSNFSLSCSTAFKHP